MVKEQRCSYYTRENAVRLSAVRPNPLSVAIRYAQFPAWMPQTFDSVPNTSRSVSI